MCLGWQLFCTLYYLPINFQGVQSYSPTLTGLGLMSITGSLLPFSILVALIIRKTGHFRWAIWSGWAISTLSSGLLILLSAETRVYAWVLIFIVVGLGHGLILIALNICTQALVHESDVVHAAVMYTFARSVGMCIGVSIGGTLFQNTLQSHLAAQGLPSALANEIESLLGRPVEPALKDLFRISITQSCKNVAELLTGVAVVGLLISWLIERSSVEKDFNPNYKMQAAGEVGLKGEEGGLSAKKP